MNFPKQSPNFPIFQMVRNHIAEKHFFSKFILSVSNSHERLGETMYKFHVKCQIWRHTSSPCFKAVRTSPKLYSITQKSICIPRKDGLVI